MHERPGDTRGHPRSGRSRAWHARDRLLWKLRRGHCKRRRHLARRCRAMARPTPLRAERDAHIPPAASGGGSDRADRARAAWEARGAHLGELGNGRLVVAGGKGGVALRLERCRVGHRVPGANRQTRGVSLLGQRAVLRKALGRHAAQSDIILLLPRPGPPPAPACAMPLPPRRVCPPRANSRVLASGVRLLCGSARAACARRRTSVGAGRCLFCFRAVRNTVRLRPAQLGEAPPWQRSLLGRATPRWRVAQARGARRGAPRRAARAWRPRRPRAASASSRTRTPRGTRCSRPTVRHGVPERVSCV